MQWHHAVAAGWHHAITDYLHPSQTTSKQIRAREASRNPFPETHIRHIHCNSFPVIASVLTARWSFQEIYDQIFMGKTINHKILGYLGTLCSDTPHRGVPHH